MFYLSMQFQPSAFLFSSLSNSSPSWAPGRPRGSKGTRTLSGVRRPSTHTDGLVVMWAIGCPMDPVHPVQPALEVSPRLSPDPHHTPAPSPIEFRGVVRSEGRQPTPVVRFVAADPSSASPPWVLGCGHHPALRGPPGTVLLGVRHPRHRQRRSPRCPPFLTPIPTPTS